MHPSLLTLPLTALAIGAPAQHPMGFSAGWDLPRQDSGTTLKHSPRAMFLREGDFLTRIDHDDYRYWGNDPIQDPLYRSFCMVGFEFVLEDSNLDRSDYPAFVTGWTEDPNRPNYPDVAGFDPVGGGSQFLFCGPLPPNSTRATTWTITFPPVCVDTGEDIFLGVNIGPGGASGYLSLHGVLAAIPDSLDSLDQNSFDSPGPAAESIPGGSYVCAVPTQTFIGYFPRPTGAPAIYTPYLSQNRMEVFLTNAAGGVCTTVTNQDSYATSNPDVGTGTASFLSGLHPDASSKPSNDGRNLAPPTGWTGDRLGFTYTDSRLAPNDPVFVLVAFEPSLEPYPLHIFLGTGPTPTGRFLIDPGTAVTIGFGPAQPVADPNLTYTRFAFSFDLPPSARDFLQVNHPTLLWQGFGIDGAGNIHATGMARQHF